MNEKNESVPRPDNYAKRFNVIESELLSLPSLSTLKLEQLNKVKEGLIAQFPGCEEEIEFIVSSIYQLQDQFEYDSVTGLIHDPEERRTVSQRLNISFSESFFFGNSLYS